jgi:hypothetical protein
LTTPEMHLPVAEVFVQFVHLSSADLQAIALLAVEHLVVVHSMRVSELAVPDWWSGSYKLYDLLGHT